MSKNSQELTIIYVRILYSLQLYLVARQIALAFDVEFNQIYKYRGVAHVQKISYFNAVYNILDFNVKQSMHSCIFYFLYTFSFTHEN